MSCQNGSQKQINAPNTISINDIGAICSLFGLEGPLCRLLDLLPEFIQKVMSRDFTSVTAPDVFEKMLGKVATKTGGLIFDELTGRIDLNAFCQSDPPPYPEAITYYDVYDFFGSVVLILSQFLEVNNVLQDNSTRLLDKIVSAWLYRKWFENCECKKLDTDTGYPPSLRASDPTPPPVPLCPDGSTPCGLPIVINNGWDSNNFPINPQSSCVGFLYKLAGGYNPEYYFEDNQWLGITQYRGVFVPYEFPNKQLRTTSRYTYSRLDGQSGAAFDVPVYYSVDGGATYSLLPIGASFPNTIPPCTTIETPNPPSIFCDLFPNDPLCPVFGCTDPSAANYNPLATVDDGSCVFGNCQKINIPVALFAGCENPRSSSYFELFDSGAFIKISVVEFVGCGIARPFKNVTLYSCNDIAQDVFGCTDPSAANYNPLATVDDGSCVFNECNILDDAIANFIGSLDRFYFCTNAIEEIFILAEYLFESNPSCGDYVRSKITEIKQSSCVFGCTDSNATNYDSLATLDDGSCVYPAYGCTDSNATNYDSLATLDDGSCVY